MFLHNPMVSTKCNSIYKQNSKTLEFSSKQKGTQKYWSPSVHPSVRLIAFVDATPRKPFTRFCSNFVGFLIAVMIFNLSYCATIVISQISKELWDFFTSTLLRQRGIKGYKLIMLKGILNYTYFITSAVAKKGSCKVVHIGIQADYLQTFLPHFVTHHMKKPCWLCTLMLLQLFSKCHNVTSS